MSCNRWLLAVAAFTALVFPVRAAHPGQSAGQLRKMATQIITGRVTAVYERAQTRGNWEDTRYVAEVRVEECEKGDGIKKGDLVYVRYWGRTWVGEGQPTGCELFTDRGLGAALSEGASVRLYLARNAHDGSGNTKDGGFNVIWPSGIEKLEPASK